ncbi:sequence-specific DNA binding [Sparganum proliferum]
MNGNHAGYSLLSALPHPYTLPVFQGLGANFQLVPGGSMNLACPADLSTPLPLLFPSALRAMGLPPVLSRWGDLEAVPPPSLRGSATAEISPPDFHLGQPFLSSSPFRRTGGRCQGIEDGRHPLRHGQASFTSPTCTDGDGEATVVDIGTDWSDTGSFHRETSLFNGKERMTTESQREEKAGSGDQVTTVEGIQRDVYDTTAVKRPLEGESPSSSEAKRYRTTYSAYQTKVLEGVFEEERYISRPQRAQLAAQLQLPENTIKVN